MASTSKKTRKYFPILKLERDVYNDNISVGSFTEVVATKIYEQLCLYDGSPENLRVFYHDGLFGSDKKVKDRLASRISYIRKTFGDRQKIRDQNMVHARNYGHMTRAQIVDSVNSSKKKEKGLSAEIKAKIEEVKRNRELEKSKDVPEKKLVTNLKRRLSLSRSKKVVSQDRVKSVENVENIEKYFTKSSNIPEDDASACEALESRQDPKPKLRTEDRDTSFRETICLDTGDYVMSELESDEDPMAICGHLTDKESSSEAEMNEQSSDDDDKEIQAIMKMTSSETKTYSRTSGKTLFERNEKVPDWLSTKKSSAEKQFDKVLDDRNKNIDKPLCYSSEDEDQKIKDVIESYEPSNKKSRKEEEDELMVDLKEGIRYVKHSSLQSSAYYMADAEDRGLKLDKYLDKVKKDLQGKD